MSGAPKAHRTRRDYQVTGVYRLRRVMKDLEASRIDGRTRAGKLRKDLIRDMGGKAISTQSRILADAIVKTQVLHDRVTESIKTLPVVNRRKKTLFPATVEAIKLTDSLVRLITLAGTDKAKAPNPFGDLGGLG